jgi:thiamine kinase
VTPPGELLARGATADVHAWTDGWVLKLFHSAHDAAYVAEEARVAAAVARWARSAPACRVPSVGSCVEWQGRIGLVYERIAGLPMTERVLQPGQAIERWACLLAELHAAVHAAPPLAELPLQRDRWRWQIESASALPVASRRAALLALEAMPARPLGLCHGDFRPGNVLVGDSGAPAVIDWHDASRGDAHADVARTVLLLRWADPAGVPPGLSADAYRRLRGAFEHAYLERYVELRPDDTARRRVQQWLPIVLAARLAESITQDERELLLRTCAADLA